MQTKDFLSSLRKVKLDQRKLTDNVNAVSDIARVRQIRHCRSLHIERLSFLVAIISLRYCLSDVIQSKCSRIKIS